MKTIINFKGMDFLVTYEENGPDEETGYLGGKEITDIELMSEFENYNFYEFFHETDLFDELQEQLNNPVRKPKPDYKPKFDAMFNDTLERLAHITNHFKS